MPTIAKLKKERRGPSTEARKARASAYASTKWRKLREALMMRAPICYLCELEGKITPADDVHHIYSPFEPGNEHYLLDCDNIIPLCKFHHGMIHGEHKEESLIKFYGKIWKR